MKNYNKKEHQINIKCNKCHKKYSVDCYINSYINNNGLIICPFCKFSFGDIIEDEKKKYIGIAEIKYKCGLISYNEMKNIFNEYNIMFV